MPDFLKWMRKTHPAMNLNPIQKDFCKSVIEGVKPKMNYIGNRRELMKYINLYKGL